MIGLSTFLRGSPNPAAMMPGCASYYEESCLFRDSCKVKDGKRCSYFEKAVLPTAKDTGIQDRMNTLYAKKVGLEFIGSGPITTCLDCDKEIEQGQKYCSVCQKRKRYSKAV